ncbi:hypothetical protein J8273_5364 [Carpediemonas membranifera]|uniref:Uncharacterized protein n=1 Tax=Carpediemonas membranifera TaxID=201153 RepID=A0A8J6B1N6_9EUKA|nr:hypothetical protein J8273_5364 [Carpediemonas membranifera]|eukprot:KAG9392374.1 hypothetical protein J8273_5364 [Carpediemonas membranifera]
MPRYFDYYSQRGKNEKGFSEKDRIALASALQDIDEKLTNLDDDAQGELPPSNREEVERLLKTLDRVHMQQNSIDTMPDPFAFMPDEPPPDSIEQYADLSEDVFNTYLECKGELEALFKTLCRLFHEGHDTTDLAHDIRDNLRSTNEELATLDLAKGVPVHMSVIPRPSRPGSSRASMSRGSHHESINSPRLLRSNTSSTSILGANSRQRTGSTLGGRRRNSQLARDAQGSDYAPGHGTRLGQEVVPEVPDYGERGRLELSDDDEATWDARRARRVQQLKEAEESGEVGGDRPARRRGAKTEPGDSDSDSSYDSGESTKGARRRKKHRAHMEGAVSSSSESERDSGRPGRECRLRTKLSKKAIKSPRDGSRRRHRRDRDKADGSGSAGSSTSGRSGRDCRTQTPPPAAMVQLAVGGTQGTASIGATPREGPKEGQVAQSPKPASQASKPAAGKTAPTKARRPPPAAPAKPRADRSSAAVIGYMETDRASVSQAGEVVAPGEVGQSDDEDYAVVPPAELLETLKLSGGSKEREAALISRIHLLEKELANMYILQGQNKTLAREVRHVLRRSREMENLIRALLRSKLQLAYGADGFQGVFQADRPWLVRK